MILNANSISKHFMQGDALIQALEGISFQVEENETLAIVGPSGSGKTTLLSLIGGLDAPTNGEIILNQQNITHMNEASLSRFRAKNIGIVFQQFHLMPHLNALENVMLPLEILKEESPEEKAKELLKHVGLESRLHHLPNQLSGGEKQRVAIARAFVSSPKLLLADEPSGNLDQKTGEKVMNLLFDQVKDKKTTMILVTHDLNLAQSCDRQIHLQGGKIV